MDGVPYKTVLDMRLHRLERRLDRSWWKSKTRAETPDRDRLEIKEARRLRAVRLFFYLTTLPERTALLDVVDAAEVVVDVYGDDMRGTLAALRSALARVGGGT